MAPQIFTKIMVVMTVVQGDYNHPLHGQSSYKGLGGTPVPYPRKPKDVVLKKLEYVYAKQKAVEAERKKLNLEEDCTVLKAAPPPPPMRDLFQSLRVEEEAKETLSSDTKKPIILARKPVLLSMETKQQQPDVSIGTSSLLMATTGQVTLKEAGVTGQVTGIPPTLVHADLSPAQMQSGMSSVVIQLPGTIFKGIIGNSPVPITLSSVPGTFSAVAQSPHESEKDDLSMMPKIVNVTSLANEAYSDLGRELGIGTPVTEKGSKRDEHTPLTEIASRDTVQAISEIIAVSSVPPRSILMNNVEESFPDLETQSPGANLVEHLPLSDFSDSNNERSSKSDNISMDDSSLGKLSGHVKDSRLELELTKLSSAIDDAGLDPSELSDVIGDQEDTDETLTSLLNEIALLNQHLINDTDDLDSGSDFPGSDTASRCSVGKFTDGESSPFSFGRFKELSETKEKNISLSPLFLQLEEGEIQESIRHNQDGGIFETDATKEPLINVAEKQCGGQKPPVTVSHCHKTETTVTSGSDVLWKPMPKLAPLGLKSPTLTSDQKILGSLSMPTLASVAIRLNSPKTMD
ncbi:MAX gene-associated protein-like [Mixophyes fleayi]|uniref:MAX gene-associated protein-like n=1 Tax=Mixophyes fleayi TaxID=3061075 RepID=UPI003F4E3139